MGLAQTQISDGSNVLAPAGADQPGWGRPGWISWLAVLLIGAFGLASTRNENVIAWLLDNKVFDESASRTLPAALTYAYVAAGAVALAIAWRVVAWPVLRVYAWAPVRVPIAYTARLMGVLARAVWRPVEVTIVAFGRVAAASLRMVAWAIATSLMLAGRSIGAAVRLSAAVLGTVWLGMSAIAQAVLVMPVILLWMLGAALFRTAGLGATAALRPIRLGVRLLFRYVGLALLTTAQAAALALRYFWGAVVAVLNYAGSVLAFVLRYAGLVIAAPFIFARVVLAFVLSYMRRAAATVLSYAGSSLAAVSRYARRTTIVPIAYAWTRLVVGLRYVWRAAATVLGYVASALAAALPLARLAVWLVVSRLFIYAWKLLAIATGYLWPAVTAPLALIKTAVAAAGGALARAAAAWGDRAAVGAAKLIRPLRQGTEAGVRFVRSSLEASARGAGYAVRFLAAVSRIAGTGIVLSLVAILRPLWRAVAASAGALGLVAVAGAHGVGTVGRYAAWGAFAALGTVGLGLSMLVRPLWWAAAALVSAIGIFVAAVAFGVGTVGRYAAWGAFGVLGTVGLGLSMLVRPLWWTVAALVSAIGIFVAAVALGLGIVSRYAGRGTFAVLGAFGSALATLARPLWWAVGASGGAIRLAMLTLGWIAARALTFLVQGLGVLLRAGWRGTATLAWVLWLVVSVPTRTVWVGVTTAWLLIGAVVGGGGRFAFSTVSTGVAAVPDAVRLVPRAVQLRKRGDAMSSSKLTRERWLSLIATLWVFGMVGFVGAAMVWPAPPEPVVKVVHWATGHLLRDWSDMRMLPAMAIEFNEAEHRTKSGTLIQIEVYNSPSSEGAADLLCRVTSRRGCHQIFDGEKRFFPDPTIISPSSGHWLVTVNHEARREVVDLERARSIARAFIGIVTYKDMAECLGWPEKELGYADILALSAHEDGWSSAGDCAKTDEWGERPLVAFTDPKTSSTGRSVLLALYAIAADKDPVDLTVAHVGRKDVVDYVKEFQGLIDHYSIGTTVLNTKIHQGPRYGHFFLMPEDNLIHLVDGTELAYRLGVRINAPPITEEMVMIYPKEGAMARNNCACIVDADWVTPEHREAADQWIDFLLEDAQQRSFMLAGFRPVTGLSLDDPSSRINARYGLDPEIAAGLDVALMDPAVAAAIDASWEDVKRPGIVTFVVDTSGSMMGGKLRQAKDGLARALGAMATNNQVGFVSFADTIDVEVPVAALRVSRYEIGGAVKELRARGDTALYDAIRVGIEMTEAAAGPADAIRAVVVLTDGQANAGRTRLDDLIAMESNEVDIARFDGFSEGPAPVDVKGRPVSRSAVVGVELATGSDVQIFFIGIGDDADLDIGRILAEATGAEFRGVAAEDLALLLEEFSGYF